MRAPGARVGDAAAEDEPGVAPGGDRGDDPARARAAGGARATGDRRGPGSQLVLSAGVACLASALTAGGVALALGRERRALAHDVEERARLGAAEVLAPEAVRRGGEAAARGAVEGLARGALDVAREGARGLARRGPDAGAARGPDADRARSGPTASGGGARGDPLDGARGGLGRALGAGLDLADDLAGVAAEEGPAVARSTAAVAAGALDAVDALLGGLAPAPRAGPGGADAAEGEVPAEDEGRAGAAAADLLDLLGAPRSDRARR